MLVFIRTGHALGKAELIHGHKYAGWQANLPLNTKQSDSSIFGL